MARLPRTRLRHLIDKSHEAQPSLPLVHSTDAYTLSDIVEEECIIPFPCNVFQRQPLIYLFYGKPSYRPNSNALPTKLSHFLPVCILFRPDFQLNVLRVFPFDTGAYDQGMYSAFLHSRMQLHDFGLSPDMSTPGRLINFFYGSVPAYLRSEPLKATSATVDDPEANSYLSLITSDESSNIDSRCSGIELQTSDTIILKNNVMAVVMPAAFRSSRIADAFLSIGADILPYRTQDRLRPSEYTSTITDACLNYYIRKGWIREEDL